MRPTRTSTIALFVAGILLFVLSASGQSGAGHSSFWAGGPKWVGTIGWFGFMACLLLLVVSGIYAIVSRIQHRSPN